MKKLIALVLALVMCFALCACGQSRCPRSNGSSRSRTRSRRCS